MTVIQSLLLFGFCIFNTFFNHLKIFLKVLFFFLSMLYLMKKKRYRRLHMEFRPCIDIHNGKVKQIVGGSLKDQGDEAQENFVSEQDGAFYAEFYKKYNIRGGHIILLNGKDSPYYNETKHQAMLALGAYPGDQQVCAGNNADKT